MDWLKEGRRIVKEVRKTVLAESTNTALNDKSNVQTSADVLAHDTFVRLIRKTGAACAIHSEEADTLAIEGTGQPVDIIIDPIDNSSAWLKGGTWMASCGMWILIEGNPSFAFVADLASQDVYSCDESRAYLNGKPLTARTTDSARRIMVGYAPTPDRFQSFFERYRPLAKEGWMLYNFGGLLCDVLVATGVFDASLEPTPTPAHELAGTLIAMRAGCVVKTLEGSKIKWSPDAMQTVLVAGSEAVAEKILEN